MIWLRRIAKTLAAVGLGAVLIFAALLWRRNRNKSRGEMLRDVADETKQAVDEAKYEAVVEMKAAREREADMKRRLEQAKAIPDKQARRLELLRLYQEASE